MNDASVPIDENRSQNLRVNEDELIGFLEHMTSTDLARVLLRLPSASNYVSEGVNHLKRVADLVGYARSRPGGIDELASIVAEVSLESTAPYYSPKHRWYRWLAHIGWALPVLMCFMVWKYPTLLPGPFADTLFCVLISVLFVVFISISYSRGGNLYILNSFGVPYVYVGSIALLVGLYLCFWFLLPKGNVGKLFIPPTEEELPQFNTSWIVDWEDRDEPRVHHPIPMKRPDNSENTGDTIGFYIEFDQAHSQYTAVMATGLRRSHPTHTYKVKFMRNESSYTLTEVHPADGNASKTSRD